MIWFVDEVTATTRIEALRRLLAQPDDHEDQQRRGYKVTQPGDPERSRLRTLASHLAAQE